MNKIAIFKTGTHTDTNGTDVRADDAMLADVVSGYDAKNHEAPAVIGHPKDNHPAYGWVKGLSVENGTLFADFDQVAPEFAQMLTDGRFKKRSASFYPPNHPANPTKGKWYLRHVGFLGAQPPAVKGLPDFSDDADCCTFEFNEHLPDEEPMPKPMPKDKTNTEETTPSAESTTDFAEREKAIEAREAKVLADEQAFAKKQQDAKEASCADFADTLIASGKLLPAEKDAIVAVQMSIDETASFDFAENGNVTKKPAIEVFKSILNRLPTALEFSELTGDDPNNAVKPKHGDGAETEEALDKKIQDFAEKNNMSYAEACLNYQED